MELFQFANVEPLNQELQPAEVPTRVTVAEGKHQRVNFGFGYGTEEKGRVDAEYHHVNFLGGARTAGGHVRWSSLDRGARLVFNQPYFLRPPLSFGAEAQQWRTFTPAYSSTVTGGKATITHRSSVRTSWALSVTSERDSSAISEEALHDPTLRSSLIALGLDPVTGRQDGTLNAVGLDFQHSTADSVLDAHRGFQISLHAEEAGRIVPGTFNYYAAAADGRHYLPINDNLVLATRAQVGSIDAVGSDATNVPFAKRYFLGGSTSVRGWDRFEISPLSSGLPIGGDSMLALSVELRAALRGNLGGVVFIDAGNVWAGPFDFDLQDLRYAIGPGLRYRTPIGPVRLDFGWQLNPIPGLLVNGEPGRPWRLHFSIGQAF
jgi:outer membrane protein insertion porin family/translocation and assembly module TamA